VYNLRVKRSAERELRRFPSRDVERITEAIAALSVNPRPPGGQKLATGDGYRVRQGDYRIVYTVDDGKRVVEIYKIGHRRDVYR
jgi:mRNA interferase RelE/StbE